ncbi:MAG: hypothetical protein J1D77_04010 [Muribaculaceae bacterium]|nr:hypothetical protein [Muribaculaceae bacterium]
MSIYFLKAMREVSNRSQEIPLSKMQLYNMLNDYKAFKESNVLGFAVKTLINDGTWNKLSSLFNEWTVSEEKLERLKAKIMSTYGFSRSIIDVIYDGFKWCVEDWDNAWNPRDKSPILHVKGLPLTGTTFDLTVKLMNQGMVWNFEKQCLVGDLHGLENCEFKFNESWKEVPVYLLYITLPVETTDEQANRLLQECRFVELKRRERIERERGRKDPRNEVPVYRQITLHRHDDNRMVIRYKDNWGYGFHANAGIFIPHNNLQSKD